MVSGWEGLAGDGALFLSSHFNDLTIPTGKFYLADAGFGACDTLLEPYCGEWGHAHVQSVTSIILHLNGISDVCDIFSSENTQELFNLHHTQAQNVIE